MIRPEPSLYVYVNCCVERRWPPPSPPPHLSRMSSSAPSGTVRHFVRSDTRLIWALLIVTGWSAEACRRTHVRVVAPVLANAALVELRIAAAQSASVVALAVASFGLDAAAGKSHVPKERMRAFIVHRGGLVLCLLWRFDGGGRAGSRSRRERLSQTTPKRPGTTRLMPVDLAFGEQARALLRGMVPVWSLAVS